LENIFSTTRGHPPILPTPVFFHWVIGGGEEGHSLMFRDTEIKRLRRAWKIASSCLFLGNQLPPQLAASYTVTSDTFAPCD